MSTLRNMKFEEVESNPGGIRSISFLAKKSEITAYPAIADSPADAAAEVTLDGDYTMDTGKVFVELYTRKGTGKVGFETTGPKDGKYFNVTAELDYPDIDDNVLATAKAAINSDNILVVGTRVANSEKFKFVALGSEMFPCEFEATGDTGTLDDDGKSVVLSFAAKDTVAMKRYTGIIQVEGGSWNCATGLFTAS